MDRFFEIDLGSRQCGLETLSLLQIMGELRAWGFLSPQLLPPTQPQFMQPGLGGEIQGTLFLVPSSMTSEESQIKSREQDWSRAILVCLSLPSTC